MECAGWRGQWQPAFSNGSYSLLSHSHVAPTVSIRPDSLVATENWYVVRVQFDDVEDVTTDCDAFV